MSVSRIEDTSALIVGLIDGSPSAASEAPPEPAPQKRGRGRPRKDRPAPPPPSLPPAEDRAPVPIGDLPPVARLSPQVTWPPGFRMDTVGLAYQPRPDGPAEYLSGPFAVHAKARADDGTGWSLVLSFRDSDNRIQVAVIGYGDLASGEAGEVRRDLASRGLWLASRRGAKERFAEALAGVRVDLRAVIVNKAGWHGEGEVFAVPSFTAAAPNRQAEPIVFQSGQSAAHFRIAGDLATWRAEVAALAEGQTRLEFALGLGFAGPLLEPLGAEGGAFNYVGASSSGKTTALRLAGSIWGGGGPLGFATSWRTTANAIEGTASAHNDSLLCLDELGLIEPRDLEAAAYVLTGGSGKGRSRADGDLRARTRWRVCVLSTGEIGLAQRLAEGGANRQAKAGQGVRFVDVDADAGAGLGLFNHVGPFAGPGALADALRERTAHQHGTAGPAFVQRLLEGKAEAIRTARDHMAAFVSEHVPDGASGQVVRVAQRFGLVAAAGELATAFDILPFSPGTVTEAAGALFRSWVRSRGGVGASEDRDAVTAVRHFLQQHGPARFISADKALDESAWRAQRVAGYRMRGETTAEDGDYLFHSSGFAEAIAGLDRRAAADALAEAGFLKKDPTGKRTRSERVGGKSMRVYRVSCSILEGDEE